jgi:hypothetical protein
VQGILLAMAATNTLEQARVVLIDPKLGVDYFAFDGLSHLEGASSTNRQPGHEEARGIARIGHDQLFKPLLQAFFADFLRLFDPETAASLDLSTISFRDTEAVTDIPQGERRVPTW